LRKDRKDRYYTSHQKNRRYNDKKAKKKASLISLVITAESQATMLLAVLNQRSIRNDAQRLKFKLFSSITLILAIVLVLRLAPKPVLKNL
jgi:hypothetical protein